MQYSLCAVVWLGLCGLSACSARNSAPSGSSEHGLVSCLAAESGEGPARQALRKAQQTASERAGDVNAWVATGDAWLRVARTHARPELFSAAQDCAERALGVDANAAPAMRLRALVMMNAHRFSEARAQARALLERDAADVLSWATLSDAELELGNLEAATEAVQQMLDRKPCLASYGRAAHLAWLKGDRVGSKRLYRAAIQAGQQLHDPEPRVWMLVQAAWVFWHEGDYAGAREGFGLALEQLPDYAPALEGLGRTLLSAGAQRAGLDGAAEYREAIRVLERALAQHALAETAWWLGDAYAAVGDSQRANAAYARVEALAERSDPRTLSLFYATQARKDRAALRLARNAHRERQDYYAKDALAFALYRNGELEQAAPLARELLASGVPDARLIYHAGLIMRDAGDAAHGGEALRRALSLNPRFDLRLTGALHDTVLATR